MKPQELAPDLYRHVKTGNIYEVRGSAIIESTLEVGIIYTCVKTGYNWVRPAKEFFDGRFEIVFSIEA